MKILVLNSGSSSQKSSLFDFGVSLPDSPPAPLWEGKLEWQGERASLEVKNSAGIIQKEEMTVTAREKATAHLLDALTSGQSQRAIQQIRNCCCGAPHRQWWSRVHATRHDHS